MVADEVRKLAERTASATTEIEQMIIGIQGDTRGAVEAMSAALPEVQEGVDLASSASASLQAIEDGARRTLAHLGARWRSRRCHARTELGQHGDCPAR